MQKRLQLLKQRLAEIDDIACAAALLVWDQQTHMPKRGAPARGRQSGTLLRLAQEKFIDPEIGRLLDALEKETASLPYDSDSASLIRVTRRDYERAIKVPPEYVARLSAHAANAFDAWISAREANDYAAVAGYLQNSVDLGREYASFFPGYDHIADPLIAESDFGMKTVTVQSLFATLRNELVPLVKAITAQAPADDSCLKRHYPVDRQRQFGEMVARRFGYDFDRGRQDKTHHPFAIKIALDDVRITTRYDEHNLNDGLFSTLHETGHALYELGTGRDLDGTPLATGTSAGVHESQSRLWENLVGRSLPFWEHFYPQLRDTFPGQLEDVSLETFYRAINRVERSLIRTEADEVTYNLHVMIRFDLEIALLEGALTVQALPEAWHARYESDLGIRAASDVNGVLQDVHWFNGVVGGAFQGYTLGNIMSASFFDSAIGAQPSIKTEIRQGEFQTLHTWLRDNIYQHGKKFTASELFTRVTGADSTITPYMSYLKRKFGALYRLD